MQTGPVVRGRIVVPRRRGEGLGRDYTTAPNEQHRENGARFAAAEGLRHSINGQIHCAQDVEIEPVPYGLDVLFHTNHRVFSLRAAARRCWVGINYAAPGAVSTRAGFM